MNILVLGLILIGQVSPSEITGDYTVPSYGGAPSSDLDLNGVYKLVLDADGDTWIIGDTDDQAEFWLSGAEHLRLSLSGADLQLQNPGGAVDAFLDGGDLTGDADRDSKISWAVDDEESHTIAGTEQLRVYKITSDTVLRNPSGDLRLADSTGASLITFGNDGTYPTIDHNDASGLLFLQNSIELALFDGTEIDLLRTNELYTKLWARDSFISLTGQQISDEGMSGIYDRTETANICLREGAVCTVTVTGAGTFTDTPTNKNVMFDGNPGNFFAISGTDGTTTQIEIHVDMGFNVPNYANATWQPYLQYRLTNGSGSIYDTVLVEVSADNVVWKTASDDNWKTDNFSGEEVVPSYWFGVRDLADTPGPLIVTWRYFRFTLTERVTGTSSADQVWLSELGIRHVSAPWTQHYLSTGGGTIWGVTQLEGGAILPAQTAVTVAAPATCNATAKGRIEVVDDSDDGAGTQVCYCGMTSDAAYDWLNIADNTACTFY